MLHLEQCWLTANYADGIHFCKIHRKLFKMSTHPLLTSSLHYFNGDLEAFWLKVLSSSMTERHKSQEYQTSSAPLLIGLWVAATCFITAQLPEAWPFTEHSAEGPSFTDYLGTDVLQFCGETWVSPDSRVVGNSDWQKWNSLALWERKNNKTQQVQTDLWDTKSAQF